MIGKKAQGTTEYLIILSVIIVIALVVVGVMGWFPGLGTQITEQQSRAYWQSTNPIAIIAWNIDTTGGAGTDLVLRNQSINEITIIDITLDGATLNLGAPIMITGGSQAILTDGAVSCPTTGSPYSFEVGITYDISGLSGVTQVGSKPLVGICG